MIKPFLEIQFLSIFNPIFFSVITSLSSEIKMLESQSKWCFRQQPTSRNFPFPKDAGVHLEPSKGVKVCRAGRCAPYLPRAPVRVERRCLFMPSLAHVSTLRCSYSRAAGVAIPHTGRVMQSQQSCQGRAQQVPLDSCPVPLFPALSISSTKLQDWKGREGHRAACGPLALSP